ncbi:MAG: hypothetical protein ACFE9T_13425, partial [Promethearchaeota archaeon]
SQLDLRHIQLIFIIDTLLFKIFFFVMYVLGKKGNGKEVPSLIIKARKVMKICQNKEIWVRTIKLKSLIICII